MNEITMGSLFDGSGGFPLACVLSGIKPVWASEIEPFPIRVTTKRFPYMKHYGDINKMDGSKIEPVDIITFGSPCQNLSVAGNRAGLSGESSSLFYQAIRIIKEMRCYTNGEYPRIAVWENVPGVFSSGKGEDFRCVLEEFARVKETHASVFMPEKHKWLCAGEIVGNSFSVAWRVLDAQYFGVAQRRKRVFLVADFEGGRAGKILFERQSLPGDTSQGGVEKQGIAGDAQRRVKATGFDGYNKSITGNLMSTIGTNSNMPMGKHTVVCLNDQGGNVISVSDKVTATLRANEHGHPPLICGAVSFEPGIMKRLNRNPLINLSGTLRASPGDNRMSAAIALENHPEDSRIKIQNEGILRILTKKPGTGGGNVHLIMNERQYAMTARHKTANTPASTDYKGSQCVFEPISYSVQGKMIGRKDSNCPNGSGVNSDVCFTLNTVDRHAVCFGLDRASFNQGKNAKFGIGVEKNKAQTIVSRGPGAAVYPKDNDERFYAVRRLIPSECALLQGFPEDWCEGLETENPSLDEVCLWTQIFNNYNEAIGKSMKSKTTNQTIKWLKHPRSDAVEYKMWGNGVALPCVYFVISRIFDALYKSCS